MIQLISHTVRDSEKRNVDKMQCSSEREMSFVKKCHVVMHVSIHVAKRSEKWQAGFSLKRAKVIL